MALGSLRAGHSQPSRSAGLVTTSCAGSHRGALSAGCLLGCSGPLFQPASQSKALRGCLIAPASLWAGHSQLSRSALPLTTSCALGLLRGDQCRQSAGVLSSAASARPQPSAARGCLIAPASLWDGHSQASRSALPLTMSCAHAVRWSAGTLRCSSGWVRAAWGCLIASASLWGHSQRSRSALALTTSCALGLLRGAQCRLSAGVCSSTASACLPAQSCQGMPHSPSKPVGWSQPAQQVSSASDHVMRTRSTEGRSVQAVCWGAQLHCISPELPGDTS